MQPEGNNAKQLIVERVRQSTNILVALNANPSVDELSAALGLTLLLNKLDKHATAVFSGTVPPAIQFLEPNKTFENTVDSLRDFIISLDKDKADRLRYKVEDDVVRIFITPYRTTITQDDLQFSQGDFNVELIIALGVDKRDDLDKAIVAHGRILHDATVLTINANNQVSSLGSVDWHDPAASSLCEMLVGLTEDFAQPGLLDAQISNALLTGIVAATERFSNQRTTPRVMTMAAQLMAAGANQQLVASHLQLPGSPAVSATPPVPSVASPKKDGELDIAHDTSVGLKKPAMQKPEATAEEQLAAALPVQAESAPAILEDLKKTAQEAVPPASAPKKTSRKKSPPLATPKEEPVAETPQESKAPGGQAVNTMDDTAANSYLVGQQSWKGRNLQPPALGGTLNATAEQALEDAHRAEDQDRNKTLLSHPDQENKAEEQEQKAVLPMPPSAPPIASEPPQSLPQTPQVPPEPTMAPEALIPPSLPPLPSSPPISPVPEQPQAPPPPLPPAQPLTPPPSAPSMPPEPASLQINDLDAARQAVSDALLAQPGSATPPPATPSAPLPPMPPLPITEPTAPLTDAVPEVPPPAIQPLPPLPEQPLAPPNAPGTPPPPPLPPTSFGPPGSQPPLPEDPTQFKIPM